MIIMTITMTMAMTMTVMMMMMMMTMTMTTTTRKRQQRRGTAASDELNAFEGAELRDSGMFTRPDPALPGVWESGRPTSIKAVVVGPAMPQGMQPTAVLRHAQATVHYRRPLQNYEALQAHSGLTALH